LQFVNPDYKVEDDRLSGVIGSAKSTVRVAIERLAEFWKLNSKIRKLVTKRDSLRQRVEALEKTLPELSPEDQEALSYYDKAADFEAK
ncbi:hypothetical protein QU886_27905, partial [Klebsiella pneumoniae]|uniref:hypothetical protein n=1 Tax=Klebsiella pneumoniae TaxID=573 RepID=UPI0038B78AA1